MVGYEVIYWCPLAKQTYLGTDGHMQKLVLSLAISHSQTTSFPDYILVTLKTSGGRFHLQVTLYRITGEIECYVVVLYSVDKGLWVETFCNQIDIDSVTL